MSTSIVISLTACLTIVLALSSLNAMATAGKRNLNKRLEDVAGGLKIKPEIESPLELKQKKSIFHKIGAVLFKKSMTKQIEEQLSRADLPLRAEEFLAIWMFAGILPVVFVTMATENIGLTILVYVLGIGLTPFLVLRAQKKRLHTINWQLGDALSIMSNSLRAGFSFQQAMEMVGREMPAPIGKEFSRAFREINLGVPTEEALQKMVKRVNSDDLDLLVTAVLIQRQVGGNLAEILDNISHTIRERIRIQGEIKTLTAQGRISGIIIGILPPAIALIMMVINPGYILPFFKNTLGQALLAAGVFIEIIGILLIRKIVNIDY
ncbi:MAG: type II secretion system F family protein [Clostridia bacterium]|jgi:tight adherence protein B|nr:type II secretion system F family protein [Clostridia bacterium]